MLSEEIYPFRASNDFTIFQFVSKGGKGKITKIVIFDENDYLESAYNLSFGDFNKIDGEVNFESRSGNNDLEKVLSTVLFIVKQFLTKYNHSRVIFWGVDNIRHWLYQKKINSKIAIIESQFIIKGGIKEQDSIILELYNPARQYERVFFKLCQA